MSAILVRPPLLLRDVMSSIVVFYVVRFSVQMLNSLLFSRRLPPGPIGWPVLGALPLLGSMPHVTLAKMAKKYGPVLHLKMGTCDMVVASTPEAAKAFLKTLDINFSNRPPNAGATNLAYNAQDLVFAHYGPRWKLLRKLSKLHFLGGNALENWSTARTTEMGHLIHSMYKASQQQEVVVVPRMLNYAMVNMVGQVFLGKRVYMTVGHESDEFKKMVVELMATTGYFNIGDWIPSIDWMDLQGIVGGMKVLHKKFDLLITKIIDEHLATDRSCQGHKDFLDVLLEHRDKTIEGERLSLTNIKAMVLNMFTAGSDTSSRTIEWALAEMLDNPEILTRAHEEMDRVVGRGRRIQESDLPKLPYLKAICKETFRKHPSVPLNLPRISSEACMVNGYYIPKNTRLSVNMWAIGRDPNVWEAPLSFNPDRFMNGKNAKIEPRGNDFELIPFGAGRRVCAGMRVGELMVQLALGTLVHCFDWKMADGTGKMDMEEIFGLALEKKVPLAALVTPRLLAEVYAQPK